MLSGIKLRYKSYLENRIRNWTGLSSGEVNVYRSNRFVLFLFIFGFTLLCLYCYSFYPQFSKLLNDGFLFFHFPKIFNLKTPEPIFFERLAQYFLGGFLLFHWIRIEAFLLEYFFSCLYISKEQKMIIYIESNLFKRKIHILKNKRMQYELEDNLILRIFGIGSLKISNENQVWEIRYLDKAKYALTEIISFDKK
ncbi:MAG TPA: PH domain-containing protein [Leptospiraceae bacterium]|nr:PH domain-containing protein [Leptospiraceae bacterium]HMX31093.1 PH domain-containing protein [Leptospiraceae bacterium]HMY31909.1 PH domain-containing protein [Leptospiraceae bacterium]HMZ67650.1 PH domain-containing protein [Leptospiraceae bacterium]HNA06276.1 PH domain-containing protein [Leptospiraceae bacterium]